MTPHDTLKLALHALACAWARVMMGAAEHSKLVRAPEPGMWVAEIDAGSPSIQCTGHSPADAVRRVCNRVRKEMDPEFVATLMAEPDGPGRVAAVVHFCMLAESAANLWDRVNDRDNA